MDNKKNVLFRCPPDVHRAFRLLSIEMGYRCGSDLVVDAIKEFVVRHGVESSSDEDEELKQA